MDNIKLLLIGAAFFAFIIILTCFGVFIFVIASGQSKEIPRFVAWCCFGFLAGFVSIEARRLMK